MSREFLKIEMGRYRHSKSGKLYEVIGSALHTETNEVVVVYKPLYENEYELFVRPHMMFMESIEVNGIMQPRFEKIND